MNKITPLETKCLAQHARRAGYHRDDHRHAVGNPESAV